MRKNIFSLLVILLSVVFIFKWKNTNAQSVTVVRGPYLNLSTPNSIVIKWRTNVPTTSRVRYGLSKFNLNNQVSDPVPVVDHEIKITGLSPLTKYYYVIGTTTNDLIAPNDSVYFLTNPLPGQKRKYKFWVVGDAGTGSNNQVNVRNAFLNYTNYGEINGWIFLGDNAYDGGFDSEYQSNVFANHLYGRELRRIVVWPALGNHDYNNNLPFSPSPAYFNIFTLPTNGEAGGIPSNTEAYYSYDYGNIHFVVLDSYNQNRDSTAQMAQWLKNDLTNNTLPWVIAYWHHPPYTKGSHNSDNPLLYDYELVEMRENIVPILENYGVDLILCGHSHSYERSFLLDGHYGKSNTLQNSMILDSSPGNFPSNCPYRKKDNVSKKHKGTVFVVCGNSGKLSSVSSGWPHPVMVNYSNSTYGSMLIEVNDNRLDAKYITSTGTVLDQFTIVKNSGKKTTIFACQGETVTLKPSWPNKNYWNPLGYYSDSVNVQVFFPTTYYTYDALNCITDTITIQLKDPSQCQTTSIQDVSTYPFIVFPTIIENSNVINIYTNEDILINDITLSDISGHIYKLNYNYHSSEKKYLAELPNLAAGIYFLILSNNQETIYKKIIIK
ncbi:MAG: metallophosphoesterase [Bacteroidia bacterium]|nr:metallophosphoesterase [Bacteroidia bacterium]